MSREGAAGVLAGLLRSSSSRRRKVPICPPNATPSGSCAPPRARKVAARSAGRLKNAKLREMPVGGRGGRVRGWRVEATAADALSCSGAAPARSREITGDHSRDHGRSLSRSQEITGDHGSSLSRSWEITLEITGDYGRFKKGTPPYAGATALWGGASPRQGAKGCGEAGTWWRWWWWWW